MTVPPAAGRAARSWLWVACVAGLVHAAFSAYWAFGGEWLLETVGQWAVDLRRSSPVAAAWGLAGIALVKSFAALVPVAVYQGRLSGRRFWRALSWAGGAGLLVYGGVNVVVSNVVLATRDPAEYDRAAMVGHALWLTRPGRGTAQRRRAATSGMAAQ
ncbi:DUF3995 domain-containing protein [Georgenia sp. Marseille-Q6866]